MRALLLRLGVVSIALLALVPPALGQGLEKAGRPYLGPVQPSVRDLQSLERYDRTLLELDRVAGPRARALLQLHRARLLSPGLQVWSLPSASARRLIPLLRSQGILRSAEPDRSLRSETHTTAGDPDLIDQWWMSAVGADRVEPPGPGKPITVIDSGVDATHPEFAARPNTVFLNTQTTSRPGEHHGTSVASVAAAPANGIGVVGVYPQSNLWIWDASASGQPTVGGEVQGIAAASARAKGVISISLGSGNPSEIEEAAILEAYGRGTLVVAASGNEFDNGNPQLFPASLSHVLTVASSDRANVSSFFSGSSPYVDLTAPGEDIPVAVPRSLVPEGFRRAEGTSFSTPIVAGAAAWIWTVRPELDNTQVAELIRQSARDLGETGPDQHTGRGLLDIPAALAAPAPPRDHAEPNDDVYLVKPNGLFRGGRALLTHANRRTFKGAARLHAFEDPDDVYRITVPARRLVRAQLRVTSAVGNADLAAWGSRTQSVYEQGARQRRNLLSVSSRVPGKTDVVTVRNRGKAAIVVYLDAFLPKGETSASYELSVSAPALR